MDSVETWAEMWNLMKWKVLPMNYQRDFFIKLQDFKQGNKSVVEYRRNLSYCTQGVSWTSKGCHGF